MQLTNEQVGKAIRALLAVEIKGRRSGQVYLQEVGFNGIPDAAVAIALPHGDATGWYREGTERRTFDEALFVAWGKAIGCYCCSRGHCSEYDTPDESCRCSHEAQS